MFHINYISHLGEKSLKKNLSAHYKVNWYSEYSVARIAANVLSEADQKFAGECFRSIASI